MLIICQKCKHQHSFTKEEIFRFPNAVHMCDNCNQKIKIAICPSCKAYYSISFNNVDREKYILKCRKCNVPFDVHFKMQKTHETFESDYSLLSPSKNFESPGLSGINSAITKEPLVKQNENTYNESIAKQEIQKKPEVLKQRSELKHNFKNEKKVKQEKSNQNKSLKRSFTRNTSFTTTSSLQNLFYACSRAFSVNKIKTAFFGTLIVFAIYGIFSFFENMIVTVIGSEFTSYINSFISIIELALTYAIYVLVASSISAKTFNELQGEVTISQKGVIANNIQSVLLNNIFILIMFNVVLILFAKIPIVGPILFAALFLPVYIISLLIVLYLFVGFWFYPPIIAEGSRGVLNNVNDLIAFVRKHNFSLLYTIPLMMVVTLVLLSIIYLVHYAAISIILVISKQILSGESLKVFSAIPGSLLQFSEVAISGQGIFKSIMDNLFVTHHIGGGILGIILLFLSAIIFSVFISIVATISTYFYTVIESEKTGDDKQKIVPLIILLLIMIIIYMAKKLFV